VRQSEDFHALHEAALLGRVAILLGRDAPAIIPPSVALIQLKR